MKIRKIRQQLRRSIKIAAVILAIPAYLFLFNGALRLLSTASDMAVLLGYLIIAVLVCGAGLLGIRLVSRAFNSLSVVLLALLMPAMLVSTGCYKIVSPGHAGILVEQTGSQRGVQDYPIKTGRVFYNPFNEDVLEYPTSVQTAVWTAATGEGHPQNEELSFQSKEGIHFTADVNCSYELEEQRVPAFYVKFRSDNIDLFTHGFMRNAVRNSFDLATQYTAEEINGEKQGELVMKVEMEARAFMLPFGVHILRLGFTAPPRPPQQVKAAIEGKVAAIQDAEKIKNQVKSSENEGEKIKALALAQAEANRVTQASITPVLIEWEKVKKWDGKLSQVQGAGGSIISLK